MLTEDLLQSIYPTMSKSHIRMLAVPWWVGHFIMTWAKHEGMLTDMLARIQLTDYVNLRDKLLDSQITEYSKEIEKTIDLLGSNHAVSHRLSYIKSEHEKLRIIRNDIVHGSWPAIGPDGEYLLNRKIRNQERITKTMELKFLIDAHERLDSLGVSVINASRLFEGKEDI